MGYDTNLMIGEIVNTGISQCIELHDFLYFSVLATSFLDHHFFPELGKLKEDRKIYFYENVEGVTPIIKDNYYKELKPIKLENVISYFEKELKLNDYPELIYTLDLMKSVLKHNKARQLHVILFGS